METEQKLPAWLFHSTENLRKLILENPELPIVVLATEDAYSDDYPNTVCSKISCHIDDVIAPSSLTDEQIFVGEDELEDWIRDNPSFQDEHSEDTDEQFDEAVKEQMEMLKNDWHKAIVVTVGN